MSTVTTIAVVLGTSVTMAAALIALARWAVTALLQQQLRTLTEEHLTPLNESMTRLSLTAETLARSLDEAKAMQRSDHDASEARADEIHRALVSLERIVAEHETQLRVHDTEIRALQQAVAPVAAATPATRPTRTRKAR